MPVRLGPAPFAKFSVHESKEKPGLPQDPIGPVNKFRPSTEFLIKQQETPPPKVVKTTPNTIKFGFGEHDLGSRKGIDFQTKDGKIINLSFDRDPEPGKNEDDQGSSESCLKPSMTRKSLDEKEYSQFLGQLGSILNSKAEFV